MPVMDGPHVVVIPYPAQGHVKPLMELSHCLVEHGFKVTFVNTEFNHRRVVAAMSKSGDNESGRICLASVPDGLGPEEDRNQLGKLSDLMWSVMPGHLEELIRKINDSKPAADSKIKCVIADMTMGWAFEVAEKLGIQRAAFWPASGALLASILHIPKLIETQIIDANGIPYSNRMIQLSPTMPAMDSDHLVWMCMSDPATQQSIFNLIVRNNQTLKLTNYFICNSSYELEPSVFEQFPHLWPIGPLLASSSRGNFWPEDSTCLSWLDQQPARSVIYVAFGSFTIFDKRQFDELALGLELCGGPFLWVVRSDLTSGEATEYPDGFRAKVASCGRMVSWAPQRDVLAHPSIACFLSHCGWNSTLEGLCMGIPFLCWPYFADQFLNQSYICDVWKVGLKLSKDENGVISTEEIKRKVAVLLGDEEIRANTMKLKEMAMKSVSHGGPSVKNLEEFIQGIK